MPTIHSAIDEDEEVWDNLQLAHMFAMHTYKKWNLGKCENYIFIVYSPMDDSGVVSAVFQKKSCALSLPGMDFTFFLLLFDRIREVL